MEFKGFFLRYSPGGVRFYAAFEVTNSTSDEIEFVGNSEGGRIYVDTNWEGTEEIQSQAGGNWESGVASLEERTEPSGRLVVKPGGKGQLFFSWNETNFIEAEGSTKFRYVMRDIKGKEYVTDEFGIHDKAKEITYEVFPNDVPVESRDGI